MKISFLFDFLQKKNKIFSKDHLYTGPVILFVNFFFFLKYEILKSEQSSAQNKLNERVASIQELFSKALSDKAVLLLPVLRHCTVLGTYT